VDTAERRDEHSVRADRRTTASGGRVTAGERREDAPGEAEDEEQPDDPATAKLRLSAAVRGEGGPPATALGDARSPGQRRLPPAVEVDHGFEEIPLIELVVEPGSSGSSPEAQ
jgi:hypothetical protein